MVERAVQDWKARAGRNSSSVTGAAYRSDGSWVRVQMVNVSYDGGVTSDYFLNMRVGEIYAIGVDMDDPYNVYAGLQDHDSWKGPSNSTSGSITLEQWTTVGPGDGMYNRSLTPFGFQSERRNFFEAQDTYLDMSPFYRADKISGALLMYHAIEDQNVGTAPISSVRMFHALQGLGKPAALYMYPYEDHGPATKETILDQWARWTAWLDIYVKNGSKDAPGKPKVIVP